MPKDFFKSYKVFTRAQLQEMFDNGHIKSIEPRSRAYILRDIDFDIAQECVLYYSLPDNTYTSMKLDSISDKRNVFYFRKNSKIAKTKDDAVANNIPENYSDTLETIRYKELDNMVYKDIVYSININ